MGIVGHEQLFHVRGLNAFPGALQGDMLPLLVQSHLSGLVKQICDPLGPVIISMF